MCLLRFWPVSSSAVEVSTEFTARDCVDLVSFVFGVHESRALVDVVDDGLLAGVFGAAVLIEVTVGCLGCGFGGEIGTFR